MEFDDIYHHEKQLEALEQRIKETKYPVEEDGQLILEFGEFLSSIEMSTGRVVKYLGQLNRITSHWGMSLKNATEKDIASLFAKIEREGYCLSRTNNKIKRKYSTHTKNEYKKCIRRFYRWYYNEDNPAIIKGVKTKTVKDPSVQRDDLLTQEEILSMIKAAEHPRDKALICVLADTGARIGEIANIAINNICFDETGAILSVDGKTGKRPIKIIFSAPDLSKWLDLHPLNDDANAPVWINVGTRSRGEKMDYNALRQVVRRTAKKAGVNKRVYNHLFRHTRSTELSNYFTEAQLEAHLGWIPGSNMPRTYVHLAAKDTTQAMLSAHGLTENNTKHLMMFQQCHYCDTKNSPAANLCSHCGRPLDLKNSMLIEELRKELNIEFAKLIANYPIANSIFQENLCVG